MVNLSGKFIAIALLLTGNIVFAQAPYKISLKETITLNGVFEATDEISLKNGFKGMVAGDGSFRLRLSNESPNVRMPSEAVVLEKKNASPPKVELIIAPNPADKETTISFYLGKRLFNKLVVRSLTVIKEQFTQLTKDTDGSYTIKISTSDYTPGIYYAILETNERSYSYQLLVK